jgi:hypothetical protein
MITADTWPGIRDLQELSKDNAHYMSCKEV